MSVHKQISKHIEKQQQKIKKFHELEEQRELYIEEAVQKCKQAKPFSVQNINIVTEKINELAKTGIVPTRKIVTKEMIEEYVHRLANK